MFPFFQKSHGAGKQDSDGRTTFSLYLKKKEIIAGLTGDFELFDYGHMRHSNAKFSKRGNLEQMLCFINVRHYVKVKLSKRS